MKRIQRNVCFLSISGFSPFFKDFLGFKSISTWIALDFSPICFHICSLLATFIDSDSIYSPSPSITFQFRWLSSQFLSNNWDFRHYLEFLVPVSLPFPSISLQLSLLFSWNISRLCHYPQFRVDSSNDDVFWNEDVIVFCRCSGRRWQLDVEDDAQRPGDHGSAGPTNSVSPILTTEIN